MNDNLNQGLPSDRFEVHWYVKSPHVVEKHVPNIQSILPLNTLAFNENGQPVCITEQENELTGQAYSITVPKDFQGLKAVSEDLALDWRLKTRRLFQKLFHAGYAAVQLEKHDTNGKYIFIKKDTLELGGE